MKVIWLVTHSRMTFNEDIITWDKHGDVTSAINKAKIYSEPNPAFDAAKMFAGAWIYNLESQKLKVPHITIWIGPATDALPDFKARLRETRLEDGTIKRAVTLKERGLYFDPRRVISNYTNSNSPSHD